MKDDYFKTMQKKLREEYNLDVINDILLGRDDQIILFSDVIDKENIKFEVIAGSLETIGFLPSHEVYLNDLFKAFDYENAFALVGGEVEYFKAVKNEILDFESEPYVTFSIVKNNQKIWIRVHIIPIKKSSNLLTVIITNVTKYLINEEELFYKTHHDSLTGLLNKYTLDYHYGERYEFDNFHALFLDLDNFKVLNDSIGHEAGNDFLRDFTNILKHFEHNYNRFYRIGGDEFVGLFFDSTDNILQMANRIIENTRKIASKDCRLKTTVSIGIVKADKREDVIRKADQLLYNAKEQGKNQYIYDEEKNVKLKK